MKKKELILEGLSCANCAVKIEEEIKKLEGANDVSINFVTKTLKVNVDAENKLKEIEEIVKEIEPDVKVYDKDKIQKSTQNKNELDDHENKFNKRDEISRLLYSLTIFIIAILVKEPFGLKLSLFIVSYIISGWKVLYRSFINIKKGLIFDENFLMSIATIGAFSIGQFAEAVGVMIFYEIGELLQALAVDNSRRSIKSLLEIRPDYANLVDDGRTYKVSPQEVDVGQLILVKPGERIPLDGVVIKGSTMVDTSALTGEPVPKVVKEGDEVLSGYVNLNGSITVKVEKEYSQSTYSKILEIVETAASKKARTEKIISKFARYYTPIVVFSAIALAVLPSILIGGPFKQWLYRALVFLVISCPCALVLSVPLGYFAGIGKLSKKGVLVKGGNYLETLKNLDTIIFDKTGTLTEGVFEVVEVKAYNGINTHELLKIAAYAESHSNHPIATSIKEYYNDNIDEKLIQEYQEIVGKGVRAKINGETVLVGNMDFMLENGVDIPTIEPNGTIVYVGINNIFAGYIKISDKIRPQTKDTINKLRELGIKKIVLLTGDNEETAKRVALELGVDEYYANLLPEDKVTLLERYLSDKPSVAFVGDGINDAPVLARSDVGIAMGGLGSDAAIEAADVVIMEDDISRIIDAINVSRKTINIIWQNIIFILAVKILFLILGALGLANMWGAVFADVGVSLLAVFNCMRILK